MKVSDINVMVSSHCSALLLGENKFFSPPSLLIYSYHLFFVEMLLYLSSVFSFHLHSSLIFSLMPNFLFISFYFFATQFSYPLLSVLSCRFSTSYPSRNSFPFICCLLSFSHAPLISYLNPFIPLSCSQLIGH